MNNPPIYVDANPGLFETEKDANDFEVLLAVAKAKEEASKNSGSSTKSQSQGE